MLNSKYRCKQLSMVVYRKSDLYLEDPGKFEEKRWHGMRES